MKSLFYYLEYTLFLRFNPLLALSIILCAFSSLVEIDSCIHPFVHPKRLVWRNQTQNEPNWTSPKTVYLFIEKCKLSVNDIQSLIMKFALCLIVTFKPLKRCGFAIPLGTSRSKRHRDERTSTLKWNEQICTNNPKALGTVEEGYFCVAVVVCGFYNVNSPLDSEV